MPCLQAPEIPYPPGLDLILPAFTPVLSIPPIGIALCCTLSIPLPPIPPIPFYLIPGISLTLQPVMTVIGETIDQVNEFLDTLKFDCPLD